MAKHIQSYSKIAFLLLMISLQSCFTHEETRYLDENTRGWSTEDTYNDFFTMVDNNGISQVFTIRQNSHDTIKRSVSHSGLTTDITYEESIHQKYFSNFGNEFEIYLQPAFESQRGDDIYIECAKIGFGYDPKVKTLNRVNTYFGNLGQSFDSNGNYTNGLLSRVEILNQYTTTYHDYEQVMYFQLKDLKDKWDDQTVVKIYIAKNVGLIKYELNNGIVYERK